MAGIMGRHFGDELIKLWGIENCRDIKIHIPLQGIVTIAVDFNSTEEQAEQLLDLLKKYRLEEIKEAAS